MPNPINKRSIVDGKLPCSKCSTTLPVEFFSKDRSMSSGYRSWCKGCDSSLTRTAKYGNIPVGIQCELCGSRDKLVVDHDHSCCPGIRTCGQCIRGWLCHSCNTSLGKLGDSVEAIERVLQYLTKPREID